MWRLAIPLTAALVYVGFAGAQGSQDEARAILEKDPVRTPNMMADIEKIASDMQGKTSLTDVPPEARWSTRQNIFRFRRDVNDSLALTAATKSALKPHLQTMASAIELSTCSGVLPPWFSTLQKPPAANTVTLDTPFG